MRKLWILVATVAALGCSKKAPQQQAVRAVEPKAAEETPLAAQRDPNDKLHGTRKMKGIDVPVYVDGAQKGVLRFGEIPALANRGDDTAPQFRLVDYLRAIGAAPETVKAIHVYDNTNRIGAVEGKELAADPDRFVFAFASGDSGNALALWDTTGLKNTHLVHEIRRMAVYATKNVPALDKKLDCVVGTDGECLDGVPGAAEPAKGTRVYVDGRLVGAVKRRQLADSTIVGKTGDDEYEFSLAKLLTTYGADVHGASSVLLVSGDDVVGRADAGLWAAHGEDVHFVLGKHQHGKVRFHVPADMQAKDGAAADKDALVTAVEIYVHAKAPERDVVAISDETEMSAQVASAAGGGGGGEGEGHASGEGH